jgi:hypothetical protein
VSAGEEFYHVPFLQFKPLSYPTLTPLGLTSYPPSISRRKCPHNQQEETKEDESIPTTAVPNLLMKTTGLIVLSEVSWRNTHL